MGGPLSPSLAPSKGFERGEGETLPDCAVAHAADLSVIREMGVNSLAAAPLLQVDRSFNSSFSFVISLPLPMPWLPI